MLSKETGKQEQQQQKWGGGSKGLHLIEMIGQLQYQYNVSFSLNYSPCETVI